MNALAKHTAHYEAMADAAQALAIIEQMRALQSAAKDCAKADVRCQSDDYERVHRQMRHERDALDAMLSAVGIDLDILAEVR